MSSALDSLLSQLKLEPLEVNLFRGHSPDDGWPRVFGGQVIGQALSAAYETVEERVCHSLHAYFLRPGDPKIPIIYEVDRSRDGGSFTSRRVVAVQHGKQIFHMAASFQTPEEGLSHQETMPDVPSPDDLMSELERRREVADRLPADYRKHFLRERPIEVRIIDPADMFDPKPQPPVQNLWFKAQGVLPDNIAIQQYVLGYASDMTLLDTALHPHGVSFMTGNIQVASLDHAMWFHRDFRMDEWLLYAQSGPSSSGGRGYTLANVFNQDGLLVASAAQEGLIRLRDKK